jgi:hypothetical protein
MLGNRNITTATLARESVEGSVASGSLQGVVLWLKGLNENGRFTLGYADEIPILISGKFLNTVSELLHESLQYDRTQVSVNPQKMVVIPFTRMRDLMGLKNQPSLDIN